MAGFGIGYQRLAEKLKENGQRQQAVELGIQALLRDRIIRAYNHYMEKGYCPIYAMENVESMYKYYYLLGGNGAITGLLEKLREMPTEKE